MGGECGVQEGASSSFFGQHQPGRRCEEGARPRSPRQPFRSAARTPGCSQDASPGQAGLPAGSAGGDPREVWHRAGPARWLGLQGARSPTVAPEGTGCGIGAAGLRVSPSVWSRAYSCLVAVRKQTSMEGSEWGGVGWGRRYPLCRPPRLLDTSEDPSPRRVPLPPTTASVSGCLLSLLHRSPVSDRASTGLV